MDENIKDQDVLLVKEPGGERLKVVSGMDDKGNLKTVPPTKENEPDFLRFDKHSNVLENFISNFMRQVKDPTHFSFFKVPSVETEKSSTFLEQQLGLPDDTASKTFIDNARLNTEEYVKGEQQSQPTPSDGSKPLDPERINWEEFERLGIDKESLEKSKLLDEMLNYRKSLCETGNLGRVAHLKMPNGECFKAFVSVDKLTNDLVALRAGRVRLPNEIKGVTLSDEQKQALAEGKTIALEGMTSKSGKSFNASVQISAGNEVLSFVSTINQNRVSNRQRTEHCVYLKRYSDVMSRPKSRQNSKQGRRSI